MGVSFEIFLPFFFCERDSEHPLERLFEPQLSRAEVGVDVREFSDHLTIFGVDTPSSLNYHMLQIDYGTFRDKNKIMSQYFAHILI